MTQDLSYEELKDLLLQTKQEKEEALSKLKKLENECNSKEGFFQQMIDKANEGMLILKGDKIKYINKTALNFLECTNNEIDSSNFSDFINQSQRGQVIQKISDLLSGNIGSVDIDIDVVTKKGNSVKSEFVFEKIRSIALSNLLLVKFEEKIGQQVAAEPTVYDISKEKLSEEGIITLSKPSRGSENLFSWNIVEIDDKVSEIFEEEKEKMSSAVFSTYVVSDFGYIFNEEPSIDFEDEFEIYVINLKKYLRFKLKCMGGKRLMCLVSDVSELNDIKKQLEKNIRQNELVTEILGLINSEISYEEKLDNIIDRISFYFKANRIVLVDHMSKKGFAVYKTQKSASGVKDLNSSFEIPFKNVPSYMKMLEERNMILGFSTKYLPPDLNTFFVGLKFSNVYVLPVLVEGDIHASLIFEAGGNEAWNSTEINYLKIVTRLIVTLYVRQFNEERLLSAKNKAESADKLKSSFLASMSHDIRIPMTSIIGFSDLLADPDLTLGEREEFIELINNSGQDLLSLVDNIIDVSKIETGQMNINSEKVVLKSMFKELYNKHNSNIKLREHDDIELLIDFDKKYEDIPFETDAFRFKQVLDNLIDNAIKFTDTGIIKFGINSIWDSTIEFYVQDTGIGMNEETQQIIFESFGKADRSYTKEYNGTGLGLTLCKSIIELMGGEIRVVSYIGKGSTFYVTHNLPKEALELLEGFDANGIKEDSDWSDKTILIAEDVMHNYKCLEFILSPTNAKIVWVKNGREAVNYFAKGNKADIVLMDIRMPILNGLDATREILKKVKVPIIAQTAYTLGDERQLAEDAGCIGYLTKPIQADTLIPYLQKLLKGE